MKNLLKITFLIGICFSIHSQTIRRVSVNSGASGVNVYQNLQAAHDAASDDDIIYVEPSNGFYTGFTCNKRLTIIGNGWADSYGNITPNPPTNTLSSYIGTVIVNDGSQNSKFLGLTFHEGNNRVNAPYISFERCRFLYGGWAIEFGSSSGIVFGNNAIFKNCRMSYGFNVPNSTNPLGPGIGCIIRNCISNASLSSGLRNAVITNNICSAIGDPKNSSITNNISTHPSAQAVSDPTNSNSVSNNLSVYSDGLPVGNGNVNGADLSTIFLSSSPNGNTPDNEYQLAANSPAISIGVGGINAGVFAGNTPYIISGLPPIPIITNFTTSGVGNNSVPLQVRVTVRGNN